LPCSFFASAELESTSTGGAPRMLDSRSQTISIGAGLVILVPSLMLMYSLVLRGRFDTSAPAVGERPAVRPSRRPGRLVPVAGVLLAVGAPLIFLTEGVTLAIGVLALILSVATGAAASLRPELLQESERAP
jgi:hypothetical protein